jgi:ABC-type polar amino acid transport system ATPase subunit
LADLFGTTSAQNFERIRELLCIVFQELELRRILDNISLEAPFQTKIEGKLSGGQQVRILIALTLCNL